MTSEDVTQWAIYIAKQLTKASQTVCQSLEEFCSLLSDKMQWFAMQQDPWRSGFLWDARMYPLHLLNPFTNPDL